MAIMPGWKSGTSRTSNMCRALILESNGGEMITSNDKKDQSPKLELIALVLSIIRLIVELLH